jgi:hypothetical protein
LGLEVGWARDLLCPILLPKSSRVFLQLHVGPCRQFLFGLDEAPCPARFGNFLTASSEFSIFSVWSLGFVKWRNPSGLVVRGVESKAKNLKVAHEYAEHREHNEFILIRASGESNPTSSCWCRFLEDCVIATRVALPALYWQADEVGVSVLDRQPTKGSTRSR